ncbi:MAG: radical SAM/SPASM domain-containing protein, partial [Actinomycetota bacterium]
LKKEIPDYPPVKLWIETSSRCNLSCGLCLNRNLPPAQKSDMEFLLFKKIIDEVKDYVYEANLFHRGEPLLNPQIVEMAEYASQNKIKTGLYTNGVLLTSALSQRLIKSGLDLITFSFDGYTKEVYEKNRCGAVFEETLKKITDFLKEKNKLGLKKPLVHILAMEHDADTSPAEFAIQKKEFIKRFKDFPPDRFVTRKPHNWGGSLDAIKLTDTKKDAAKFIACTFPWYALVILQDGKVTPCPQDFYGNMIAGDVNTETVEEIFNNEKMQAIRKAFKNKNIENLNICKDCDRCRRETFLGVPKEYLKKFMKDSILKN